MNKKKGPRYHIVTRRAGHLPVRALNDQSNEDACQRTDSKEPSPTIRIAQPQSGRPCINKYSRGYRSGSKTGSLLLQCRSSLLGVGAQSLPARLVDHSWTEWSALMARLGRRKSGVGQLAQPCRPYSSATIAATNNILSAATGPAIFVCQIHILCLWILARFCVVISLTVKPPARKCHPTYSNPHGWLQTA